MATADIKGVRHEVRVTSDLTENFAVELFPTPKAGEVKRAEPYKAWPTPLCLKLKADSPGDALRAGLEHLKKLGRITDYQLEEHEKAPPPPAPPAAATPAATAPGAEPTKAS